MGPAFFCCALAEPHVGPTWHTSKHQCSWHAPEHVLEKEEESRPHRLIDDHDIMMITQTALHACISVQLHIRTGLAVKLRLQDVVTFVFLPVVEGSAGTILTSHAQHFELN